MKDNTTKEKMVMTIDGTEELRSNCRYIKKEYYRIGDTKVLDSGQCYLIGDKYYRGNTGYIAYDYSINEYVVKNASTLVSGVVDVKANGELVFGDFTLDKYSNVKVQDIEGSSYMALNSSIFNTTRWFRLCLTNGKYFHINNRSASDLTKKYVVQSSMKRGLPYNASEEVMNTYVNINKDYTPEINPVINAYAKYLKDLSFGVEFETVKGSVPDLELNKSGLIPLRDGSIKGIEYVTIPLSGEKGLQCLTNACDYLTKYTENDTSCSLHLHIGNIPRTETFILALFRVLACVQDSMYKLFPLYKRNNLDVKRQNYTKEIPFTRLFGQMDKAITKDNAVENFDVIYKYLSGGYSLKQNKFSNLDAVTHHPSDPRGTSKWYIQSRYSWVNIIPLVFGNKKTVEFRIHTGTTDVNKTLNFLYICSAIVNFAKDHESSILKGDFDYNLNLSYIIDNIYRGDLKHELLNYVDTRQYFQYRELKAGKIETKESEFKYSDRYFKWSTNKVKKVCNINLSKENPGLNIPDDLVRRLWARHPAANHGIILEG